MSSPKASNKSSEGGSYVVAHNGDAEDAGPPLPPAAALVLATGTGSSASFNQNSNKVE
jgi:hypothetical protein